MERESGGPRQRLRGASVSSAICAVHYSGLSLGAAENDFFATDENLIELR
jgi:hypothetical protein